MTRTSVFLLDVSPSSIYWISDTYFNSYTSLVSSFRKKLKSDPKESLFFVESQPGRKEAVATRDVKSIIISLRKKYYSVPDIKVILDASGHSISEKNIYNIIAAEGFARLPRRTKMVRQQLDRVQIPAEKSEMLFFNPEVFKSSNAGILMFLTLIKRYKIDAVIERSAYPATFQIGKIQSILCFLALKLSNRRRYSGDDTWNDMKILPHNDFMKSLSSMAQIFWSVKKQ